MWRDHTPRGSATRGVSSDGALEEARRAYCRRVVDITRRYDLQQREQGLESSEQLNNNDNKEKGMQVQGGFLSLDEGWVLH